MRDGIFAFEHTIHVQMLVFFIISRGCMGGEIMVPYESFCYFSEFRKITMVFHLIMRK